MAAIATRVCRLSDPTLSSRIARAVAWPVARGKKFRAPRVCRRRRRRLPENFLRTFAQIGLCDAGKCRVRCVHRVVATQVADRLARVHRCARISSGRSDARSDERTHETLQALILLASRACRERSARDRALYRGVRKCSARRVRTR